MHQTFSEDAPKEIIKGIGITSLIFGICVYLPFLGFIFGLLFPLPILFYRTKLGRRNGILVASGTMMFMVFLPGNGFLDIFFFVQLLVLGLALGEFFEKKLPVEKTILYSCVTFWTTAMTVLVLASLSSGMQITEMVAAFVGENLKLSLAFYEKMEIPPEQAEMIGSSLELIEYALIRVIPGIVTAAVLLIAWSNLLLARPVLAAAKIHFPDFGRLNTWRAPDPLVWGVICCGIMLLFDSKGLKISAVNGLIVLSTIYFFQGIAIVSFFFEKKDIPVLLRIILYCFIGMQLFLFWLVIALGFFDMWLDLRKLDTPEENQ